MRAMSKQKKWEIKQKLAPYNHAKRALAAKVAAEKEKLGIAKRKGLQGRIDYWNQLYDLPMNDARALLALNGINNTVDKTRFKLPDNSVWSAANYQAYKAALKAKAQARKDLIARMTEAERDTYKKRAKMLSAARKLMVGYRKEQRELDKKASNLTWGKITMHSFEPEFARALAKAKATDPDKFADIQPADLIAYLRNPKASFFGSYTQGIEGLANRAIQGPTAYVNAPLNNRAAVNWDEEAAAPAAQGQQGNNMQEG